MLSANLAVAAGVESELRIAVRVRNEAHLPVANLIEAERVSAWIFQGAGITTEWLDCSPAFTQLAVSSPCDVPTGPAEVLIEFLPDKGLKHLGFEHRTLGVAHIPVEERFATNAFSCCPCVKSLASTIASDVERESLTSAILGSVMAHELGHLLGVRDHALRGVMHAPWSREELAMAQQGRLFFISKERRAIQAEIQRRMRGGIRSTAHQFEAEARGNRE